MGLTRSTDPLVWIDCEMTGLNPNTDKILEVQCYVTDASLNIIEPEGCHVYVLTPKATLDAMNDWCKSTHGNSGLTEKCLDNKVALPEAQAAQKLFDYLEANLPVKNKALLAGNSVHADKMFLMKEPWALVLEQLHYRVLDVSAVKEAVRRWASDEVLQGVPAKKLCHTADEDIKESIAEARYYMHLVQNLNAADSRRM